jgi:hypothetical protein
MASSLGTPQSTTEVWSIASDAGLHPEDEMAEMY